MIIQDDPDVCRAMLNESNRYSTLTAIGSAALFSVHLFLGSGEDSKAGADLALLSFLALTASHLLSCYQQRLWLGLAQGDDTHQRIFDRLFWATTAANILSWLGLAGAGLLAFGLEVEP